jgi:formyltetrahydrofolate hydrolase
MKTEIETLKTRIRKRFGSIKRFCKTMNENNIQMNYTSLTNAFSGRTTEVRQKYIVDFVTLLLSDENFQKSGQTLNDLIHPQEREEIRLEILKNFKNVSTFSKLNDEFNQVFVHNVISGKRKKRDKRFSELQKMLTS